MNTEPGTPVHEVSIVETRLVTIRRKRSYLGDRESCLDQAAESMAREWRFIMEHAPLEVSDNVIEPKHIKLAVRALREKRGDETERFEHRYGTPDRPSPHATPEWWDAPASWNPAMTPRETLQRYRDRAAAIDAAIVALGGTP